MTFGTTPEATVWYEDLTVDERLLPSFRLVTPAGSRHVSLRMAGIHQASNAAAAVAAGIACGVDLDTLIQGLEGATGSPWRMEVHEGSFTVVNDAYNANPQSMEAALRTVSTMPGRHLAVLGRMAELGIVERDAHLEMGRLARSLGYAVLVVVGEDPGLAEGAGPIARNVPDPEEAIAVLRHVVQEGDVVLVKASRAVGLERVAVALADEAAA